MPLFLFVAGFFGVAVLSDLFGESENESFGYGEASLSRVPLRIWDEGSWGLRGRPRNWRSPGYGDYQPLGNVDLGVRGPTHSWRHPLPREWEIFTDHVDEFGVLTGAGGIRGVASFESFTPEQQAAMRREEAAQGLRAASAAPSG